MIFLILTKGYWTYHVNKLELTLNKLKVKGLKYNIEIVLQTDQNGIFRVLGNTRWRKTHK